MVITFIDANGREGHRLHNHTKSNSLQNRVIVDLNVGATILIELYNEDISIPISTIGKVDEYTQLGDDDSYIESIIQRELQCSILHMNKQSQFIKKYVFL